MADARQNARGNVADFIKARRQKAADDEQNTTENRHGNRRFDEKKVARLKAAIAAGEYRINTFRVADKLIEHERNG